MKLFNIAGFQICWWLCVLCEKNNLPYIGPLFMLIFIILHLFFISKLKKEYKLIILSSILGILIDGSFKLTGMIDYIGDSNNSFFVPLWIIAMWAGFSSTINHSLFWLKKLNFFSFLLGSIFGPLSYIAGYKLNVILFDPNIYTIIILSLTWGASIPFLFYINKRLNINTI